MIALYEASRECVWLRAIDKFILNASGLSSENSTPTIIYEDNAACIAQITAGYIKGKNTKHILTKFFYVHEQLGSELEIQKVKSHDNLADLFTKALLSSEHRRLVKGIGMRSLHSLQ
jgi:hypothetical protein